jgi:chromosomal replication initiator protein
MNLWENILQALEKRVNRHSLDMWFRKIEAIPGDDQTLTLRVPNNFWRDIISSQYRRSLDEALEELNLGHLKILFEVTNRDTEKSAEQSIDRGNSEYFTAATRLSGSINPRYTFDSFVVGPSNQFANAACRAVAETPSRCYNPLFIYGGVGLGKTHLIHSIGNTILAKFPDHRLIYISSEKFMNEMINAIRFKKTGDFQRKYRTIDVLLIDDIQFLGGKEMTQVEFFHTFNDLYNSQKQIVMTSDSAPKEIPKLEERLRSRFEWGLIADIQPPDLETKVAILRKKAELEGIDLPMDVALFIASKIRSNIRELEGSLIRVIAFASLTGSRITLDLAQETLKNLFRENSKVISIEVIQEMVAEFYNLKPAVLKTKNNSRCVSFPRQIAMYLSKQLTNSSFPEIGRNFGGKHHSTVMHSIKKIEKMRKEDPDFNKQVNSFINALN